MYNFESKDKVDFKNNGETLTKYPPPIKRIPDLGPFLYLANLLWSDPRQLSDANKLVFYWKV
jgi:hypothetical protein